MATAEKTNESSGRQPSQQKVGATPSGLTGGNPSTAGPGKTDVNSNTPENAEGHINPSAPNDSNVTPGSVDKK